MHALTEADDDMIYNNDGILPRTVIFLHEQETSLTYRFLTLNIEHGEVEQILPGLNQHYEKI